jgi:hypothetical protein
VFNKCRAQATSGQDPPGHFGIKERGENSTPAQGYYTVAIATAVATVAAAASASSSYDGRGHGILVAWLSDPDAPVALLGNAERHGHKALQCWIDLNCQDLPEKCDGSCCELDLHDAGSEAQEA